MMTVILVTLRISVAFRYRISHVSRVMHDSVVEGSSMAALNNLPLPTWSLLSTTTVGEHTAAKRVGQRAPGGKTCASPAAPCPASPTPAPPRLTAPPSPAAPASF